MMIDPTRDLERSMNELHIGDDNLAKFIQYSARHTLVVYYSEGCIKALDSAALSCTSSDGLKLENICKTTLPRRHPFVPNFQKWNTR